MKQQAQVSILNQTFSVETDASDKDVDRITRYINKKIQEIQKQTRKASSLHVALLACMNIAHEFLRYQGERQGIAKRVEKKIQDLIEIVDLQL